MVLDMTTGSPLKKMGAFLLPVLMGNLLQQFYSIADSVIVSRFLGVQAFAGVSATGILNFLIIGFTMGLCMGCAIPISQEFGANERINMRRCFANAIYLTGTTALVMAVITSLLAGKICAMVGTPEDIFDYSVTYIRIIFMGMPATVMYNILASSMRAVGDGRTPLIMLLVSSLLNIVLDLLFVITFKMGIAGAAWATVLSQFISALLCVYVIFGRNGTLKIRRTEWRLDFSVIRRLAGIGVPMGLQFSITAIGGTILQTAINSLGSSAVAAIGTGAKIQFIFSCPLDALGVTMATYTGQNLGAKKMDRIRQGVRQVTWLSAAYSLLAYALQLILGKVMVRLFIDGSETELIAHTLMFLRTVVAFTFLLSLIMIYRNAIQGMGYSKAAMFAGLMELFGRAFVAFVLARKFGFRGVCFANPIAWACAVILLLPMYFVVFKKQKRIINAQV